MKLKKEIALREERHAAQLKARKQRSSKSCVKKDTNWNICWGNLCRWHGLPIIFELSKADQVAVRNHCLADEIKDIFSQHKGRYGVRRVYQELIKRGHKVNHKRVQRLMHTMGWQESAQRKSIIPTRARSARLLENILDRDFSTTALCKMDYRCISVPVFVGKCYLSPILDMNTNEIISLWFISKCQYGTDPENVGPAPLRSFPL